MVLQTQKTQKTQKIQDIGIFKDQVRAETIFALQCVQLMRDEFIGLFGKGSAFKKHGVDLLPKGSDAPSLHPCPYA